ncbi:hypothetical protein D3C78_1517300 [compost metagenome]
MKLRSRSRPRYCLSAPFSCGRGPAGMVSGSQRAIARPTSALNSARQWKIDCQPEIPSSTPPASGARIGASPITSISCENARAAPIGSHRSRTTARDTTIPAQPPSAWTKRAAISHSRFGAKAQATEARVKMTTPSSSGMRRPSRSASGP